MTDLDRELALRLRVRRDTLLLAVVGDGPTAALQAWRALRRAGPAEATADVAALAALPPGTTVLHALTQDQGAVATRWHASSSTRPLWTNRRAAPSTERIRSSPSMTSSGGRSPTRRSASAARAGATSSGG